MAVLDAPTNSTSTSCCCNTLFQGRVLDLSSILSGLIMELPAYLSLPSSLMKIKCCGCVEYQASIMDWSLC